jgi:hypothetical protein
MAGTEGTGFDMSVYPACLLLNMQTKRWHPIYFYISPPPGPYVKREHERYKSSSHHTSGFATVEEAIDDIKLSKMSKLTGVIYGWDGESTPAMVEFFPTESEMVDEEALIKEANELLAKL